MRGYIVREQFTRNGVLHPKGTIIREPDRVADLENSDHDQHLIRVHLPDEAPDPEPEVVSDQESHGDAEAPAAD